MSPDEIDSAVKTYVFIDLDEASLGDDVMNAQGLTLFKFIRNVSLDVQSSLQGIDVSVSASQISNVLLLILKF